MLVEPSAGNTPGTQQPESVSTKRRRIATLARSDRFDPAAPRVRKAAVRGRVPERICQVKTRMREIRTSGSVRGGGGNPLAYSTSGGRDAPPFQYSNPMPIVRNKADSRLGRCDESGIRDRVASGAPGSVRGFFLAPRNSFVYNDL
jgi:hypothetical protein